MLRSAGEVGAGQSSEAAYFAANDVLWIAVSEEFYVRIAQPLGRNVGYAFPQAIVVGLSVNDTGG